MAQTGIITLGNYILGFDARTVFVSFDVAPELKTEISVFTSGFLRYTSWKYCHYEYLLSTYTTRYVNVVEEKIPFSEKKIYVHYAERRMSDRFCTYYFLQDKVYCFCEGLYTQTPLLLKNYKYNNWARVPNILTPEFYIWSFYELDVNSIEITIQNRNNGDTFVFAYNIDKDKFTVEKVSDYIYRIKLETNVYFENGAVLDIYVSVYDVKGNYLKEGLW